MPSTPGAGKGALIAADQQRHNAAKAPSGAQPDGADQPMTQTTSRIFDDLAKMMTNAAGAAQGLRREIETVVRSQAERMLREMDVVQREEFEAVKAMAQLAREENERLARRIAELEALVQRSPGLAESGGGI
jgi:BMFP domain-containing protein YqiC